MGALRMIDVAGALAPRSLWYESLARRAGSLAVDDWLVAQANLRNHRGAWVTATTPRDPELTEEQIVVGLMSPHAPLEGRKFKLVVRMLQSGRVDGGLLALLARREWALGGLHWLLSRIPADERTPAVEAASIGFVAAPRGYRELAYDYRSSRLLRRPAGRDAWRAKPSAS